MKRRYQDRCNYIEEYATMIKGNEVELFRVYVKDKNGINPNFDLVTSEGLRVNLIEYVATHGKAPMMKILQYFLIFWIAIHRMNGADLNFYSEERDETLLMTAVCSFNYEIAEFLMCEGKFWSK